jgi:hypothetical protein
VVAGVFLVLGGILYELREMPETSSKWNWIYAESGT